MRNNQLIMSLLVGMGVCYIERSAVQVIYTTAVINFADCQNQLTEAGSVSTLKKRSLHIAIVPASVNENKYKNANTARL